MPAPLVGPNSLRPLAGLAQDEPGARGDAARGGRGLGSVSRRSEVLPYSGEQIGGGNRCECDKERRNQVIDHNTNSTAGSSTEPSAEKGLLRLHVRISAWRARRRNDFEMTAARRRDLHVPVNPGRRADDSLRLGEFVAEWSRTATAHRWRIALDIGRACRPFLGRRIPSRLWRWRTICRSDADERCNDQDGGTQRQLLADLRSVLFNAWPR
jgi:hypothetical protein